MASPGFALRDRLYGSTQALEHPAEPKRPEAHEKTGIGIGQGKDTQDLGALDAIDNQHSGRRIRIDLVGLQVSDAVLGQLGLLRRLEHSVLPEAP